MKKFITIFLFILLSFSTFAREKCKITYANQDCRSGDSLVKIRYENVSNQVAAARCDSLPVACNHNEYEAWRRQAISGLGVKFVTGPEYYRELDSKGNYVSLNNIALKKCFLKNAFLGSWKETASRTCQFKVEDEDPSHGISPPPPGSNTSVMVGTLSQLSQQASQGESLASSSVPSALDFTLPAQEALTQVNSELPGSSSGPGSQNLQIPRINTRKELQSSKGSAASGGGASQSPSSNSSASSLDSASPQENPAQLALDDTKYGGGSGANEGSSGTSSFDLSSFMQASQGQGSEGSTAESLEAGSRGLASLSVEDPSDYFMRTGIEESLFRKVSTRYSQHQRKWILIQNVSARKTPTMIAK